MEAILVTASATVSWVLILSALGHASSRGLGRVLRDQDVLPAWAHVPVAVLVVALEAMFGVMALGAIWSMNAATLSFALVLQALLLAGYASYLAVLLARGSAAPCGCSTSETAVSRAAVGRNLGLAVLAVIGAANPQAIAEAGIDALAVGTVAGLAFGVLSWILPDALATFEFEEADR